MRLGFPKIMMPLKNGSSGGVECAKYGLLTLLLVTGPVSLRQIWLAPRGWGGYLGLGIAGLCLWLVNAIDQKRSHWAASLQKPFSWAGRIETWGFLVGMTVNLFCAAVFLAAAQRLTATSTLSTDVLSCAPLILGLLVILPILWAYQANRQQSRSSLAAGLVLGIPLQLGCFWVWYTHWVQSYAG